MPRWKRVIRHGTRPAEDTIALPSADDAPVELWTTGFDALSAQAAPEGVVHKSTGVMPGIALRNGMQRGRLRDAPCHSLTRRGARNKARCRLNQNAVHAIV